MRRVLGLPDFRYLWLSQAVSTIGDRLVLVVLALYVNDIGTPSDVGIVLAAHGIPFVGLLLVGGVWADRLPRHLVMVTTDLVRAALHGLLAVLILTGDVPIWAIAAIEAAFGAAEAFFRPAYTGLIPQTVPDELIGEAQAVTQLTFNVAGFAGPALGSALFLSIGSAGAFAVDAATFAVSAALLVRVRPRERGERAEREPILAELRGGWDELRARPWAGLVILGACLTLLIAYAPYSALGPAIADEAYGEAAVYGLIAAAAGAGSLAGAVLALRWWPRRVMFIAQLWVVPWPLMLVAFAAGAPLYALLPVGLLAGVGLGLFMVWWETALAQNIPPAALSRVSAFDWMGSLGLLPLGFLLAGPIGEALGVRETLLAGAGLALVANLAVAAALRGAISPVVVR
jgi:predicted MFS family arabinose efflux permease